LGLETPWTVRSVELNVPGQRVDVWAGHAEDVRWPCPECGTPLGLYDHSEERVWRHLDSCQFMTYLHAQPPRVECPTHGVRQVRLPWAEVRARFTALFERLAIDVLKETDIRGATRILRISWDEAWHILERAVERGQRAKRPHVTPHLGVRSRLAVVGIVALALASCATIPTPQDANDAVLMLRKYHAWAWAVGIPLIWADLVLPVPQTVVIAALGIIYGTVLGGLLGSVGLITGGLLGYVLMFTSARRMVKRFVGPQSLNTMESLFERTGAWAIVLSRSLPYSIPEALVFLAGLAGMPRRKFTLALAVGSAPTAFAFAAIGAGWADQPILALGVSYVLPILLLPIALYLMRLRAL
jgi:uncharacterized membrane protein YdjX (TVP38/TMEM64 family)